MKIIAIALAVILSCSITWYVARRPAPQAPPPEFAALEIAPSPPVRTEQPLTLTQPGNDSEQLLERLNQVLSKLENLEITLNETQTQITLRSESRSRTPVTLYPADSSSRLGDQDLENLRTLIREEIEREAWKARQRELVGDVRRLATQLPMEARTIDPLTEVLCTSGRTFFDLERELALHDHERGLAKRRVPDFKQARRRLRDEIGSVYRDDELAARVFLHVVSKGEVASVRMDRDRLLATEKDWLR